MCREHGDARDGYGETRGVALCAVSDRIRNVVYVVSHLSMQRGITKKQTPRRIDIGMTNNKKGGATRPISRNARFDFQVPFIHRIQPYPFKQNFYLECSTINKDRGNTFERSRVPKNL